MIPTIHSLHPKPAIAENERKQHQAMKAYYRLHAKIYDSTRWTFLFGRKGILNRIPLDRNQPWNILEIGCGTGHNLEQLARIFPKAHLHGVDVSEDMLDKAQKRLQAWGERIDLYQGAYEKGEQRFTGNIDLVLFSYSLTMINPQYAELIEQAASDLKPGGLIAVVDFHNSRFGWFKRHMGKNHVRMDSHLPPVLERFFQTSLLETPAAYGGVWNYLLYIGSRSSQA